MVDEVLFARLHSHASLAAAFLLAVDADGTALDVAGVGHGDDHVLFGDHVLDADLLGLGDDLGAPVVAELVLDLVELLANDAVDPGVTRKDGS